MDVEAEIGEAEWIVVGQYNFFPDSRFEDFSENIAKRIFFDASWTVPII